MTNLERQFHEAMLNLCDRARDECNVHFTRLRGMLANEQGVQVAKKLINASQISEGFISLMELDRLDLSVERLVLKEEWRGLFEEGTLNNARKKLR